MTKAGDGVIGNHGERRIVVEVEDAADYLERRCEERVAAQNTPEPTRESSIGSLMRVGGTSGRELQERRQAVARLNHPVRIVPEGE